MTNLNNSVKALTWEDVLKLKDTSNIDLVGYSNEFDESDMPYIHTINVQGKTLAEIKSELTILFLEKKKNIQLLTNDEFLNFRKEKFNHDYKIGQVQEISEEDYNTAFDCFHPENWINNSRVEVFRFLSCIDQDHNYFFIKKKKNDQNLFFKIATKKDTPYKELFEMIANHDVKKPS